MEIKDYIHFYLKQECLIDEGHGNEKYFLDAELLHRFLIGDDLKITLILRKLSDMTEEELKQCVANEWGQTHTFTEHYCKKKISEISASTHGLYNFLSFYGAQQSLPYLLKQGFDLFGLIPAGLAIDKTSLKN